MVRLADDHEADEKSDDVNTLKQDTTEPTSRHPSVHFHFILHPSSDFVAVRRYHGQVIRPPSLWSSLLQHKWAAKRADTDALFTQRPSVRRKVPPSFTHETNAPILQLLSLHLSQPDIAARHCTACTSVILNAIAIDEAASNTSISHHIHWRGGAKCLVHLWHLLWTHAHEHRAYGAATMQSFVLEPLEKIVVRVLKRSNNQPSSLTGQKVINCWGFICNLQSHKHKVGWWVKNRRG